MVEATGFEPASVTVQAWCRAIAASPPKQIRESSGLASPCWTNNSTQPSKRIETLTEDWNAAPESNRVHDALQASA